MFNFVNGLSDRTKLLAPIALCVLALLGVGWLSWSTIDRVKVGGPVDAEILSGKDLMADVLPPPMYLVETHLSVQESAGVGDPRRATEFVEKYTALRKEYDERQAHWLKTLPQGPTRDLVSGPLHNAAREYFAVCEQQLIPALRAGDEVKARELANGVLKDKYRAQRAIVDDVVKLTEAENKAKSEGAAVAVRTSTRLMLALTVVLPLLSVVIAVIIVRKVTGATQAALTRAHDAESIVAAISRAQAVIEFKLDGTILTANDNFLTTLGYSLVEIQGRHHSMFAEPAFAAGPEYREFWAKLNRGEYVASEFKRIGKGGKEVWIQASYNPVLGTDGKPSKVVKFATDITAAKSLEMKVKEDAAELQQKVGLIVQTVDALAAGDFTQQVPNMGADVVGQMAAALNKAIGSVRTALEGVRDVSEQLADASGQLASASEEISTGAQEQASSLEETASTLEEITATVRQSADNAQQARQLASGSKEVAEKGGQVVSGAVEAMSEINASSKKIAEIITAIDEIAFQTNLLALNAAVEAARAGEQGRGFAVVAAEVRNLAQRSATAAKEIKSLINDSVKKVDAGTDLVNRSGATLSEIVTSVKRVTDIVTEIAAASKEQSSGIEQVNKAVSQMDSVTQRNASQTEEMSATAQTLTDQAGQLRDLVARFKLSDEVGRAPARPAARPAKKVTPATKPRPAVARALKNGHSNGNGNGHGHELDSLGSDDGFTEF